MYRLTEAVWIGGAAQEAGGREAPVSVLACLVLLAGLTIAAGLASATLVDTILVPAARGAL
jgi:hypothetical protein